MFILMNLELVLSDRKIGGRIAADWKVRARGSDIAAGVEVAVVLYLAIHLTVGARRKALHREAVIKRRALFASSHI